VPDPAFPGAVGVTHLRVYDTEAPDGLRGGTPHVHSTCTEAYAVAAGRGLVQTMTADGCAETPLEPGSFVWFTPGTIHRLVNTSGDLEIFVIMANAGLPEAGDMVLAFPPDVLGDPARYAEAMALPEDGARRDLAVEGFAAIRAGGTEALAGFHRAAAALLAPRTADWRAVWETGPKRESERVAAQLDAVAAGDPGAMAEATVRSLPPVTAGRAMGCCGTLGKYLPDF
jgi:mannose-6-phosphate isomerase-like protein (cupin superfamily)